MDKKKVHDDLSEEIKNRMEQLNALLLDAMDTTSGETKSSAGDKHETSRAMAQIEQDKIAKQLFEMSKLLEIVMRLRPEKTSETIQLGSLIHTSNGWFYLSVGIGLLQTDGNSIFCMATSAPLGKMLLGKKNGDEIEWRGEIIEILRHL